MYLLFGEMSYLVFVHFLTRLYVCLFVFVLCYMRSLPVLEINPFLRSEDVISQPTWNFLCTLSHILKDAMQINSSDL